MEKSCLPLRDATTKLNVLYEYLCRRIGKLKTEQHALDQKLGVILCAPDTLPDHVSYVPPVVLLRLVQSR